VTTAANGFLQGKFKQGFSDTARVTINTILGFGGLLDVATKLEFEKHYEDLGQTLGVWGVAEGPYLILPFFGPQTLRGTVGLAGDAYTQPLNNIQMAEKTRTGFVVLNVVNARSNLLAASSVMDSGALDPYLFVRDRYINWRRKQVYDGKPTSARRNSESDELDELDELDESQLILKISTTTISTN